MTAFAFSSGKQEDEEKAVYLRRDLEKGVTVYRDTAPLRSAKNKPNQPMHYAILFNVNFTPKITHSGTYLQSNRIAGKVNFKLRFNFAFASLLHSKGKTCHALMNSIDSTLS